jgi:hypothetical protein
LQVCAEPLPIKVNMETFLAWSLERYSNRIFTPIIA